MKTKEDKENEALEKLHHRLLNIAAVVSLHLETKRIRKEVRRKRLERDREFRGRVTLNVAEMLSTFIDDCQKR